MFFVGPFFSGVILGKKFAMPSDVTSDVTKINPLNFEENELKDSTIPETNIFAPENGWLEYYFPIGEAYFQGLR